MPAKYYEGRNTFLGSPAEQTVYTVAAQGELTQETLDEFSDSYMAAYGEGGESLAQYESAADELLRMARAGKVRILPATKRTR
jgi:hypothetical protein